MDETIGLKLIEELKDDPEKFRKERKSYQLLQEYFKGLSKETLRELLCFQDKNIKQTALWITSELGRTASDLLKEVVPHMNDDDDLICYYALGIVSRYANDEYIDDFLRVFTFLEHSNQEIRTTAMLVISNLSGPRIHEAYVCLTNKKNLNDSHEKGLLALINVNALTASEVTHMINSDDDIIRKYGVIAAKKLYEKYPEIINEATNAEDLDIRDFSRTIVQAEAEYAQYLRNRKHPRRSN